MVAIILAGGHQPPLFGTTTSCPTPLTSVSGRPFLFWVTKWLKRQGFRHLVFAAGHGPDALRIQEAVEDIASLEHNLIIDVVIEPHPLGTAGAAAYCAKRVHHPMICVVNGDAILTSAIRHYVNHFDTDTLDGMMLGVHLDNAGRFGTLETDEQQQLTAFYEKTPRIGLVNAGVYFLKHSLLQDIPADKVLSFENDMFTQWIQEGKRLKVIGVDDEFIDVSTAEGLKRASQQIEHWAKQQRSLAATVA